jgi:hypothetical protein
VTAPAAAPRPSRRLLLTATTLGVVAILTFGVAAPPEHCPTPTADTLQRAADDAVQWFVRNQRDDGRWLYEYDAGRGVAPDDYNLVRHAGGIMGLYQAATAGIDGALESADRGLEWAQGNLLTHDGWTALASGGRAPVGGSALLAAGLAERRLLTGEDTHDDLLLGLGRFMVGQTRDDGAVMAQYDTVNMTPEVDSRSKYYTGEAYWALARLHLLFPDEGFGAVADRIGNYLATRRDDVEDLWPPIPDHWVAYGLAETVTFPERDDREPLTEAELDYTRRQAGLFGSQVRWVSQQAGPWGSLVRGTKVPRGGGYGVVGEALTGHWRVAMADDRLADARQPLADRAACIAGLAVEVQGLGGRGQEGRDGPSDPLTDGAWFIDDVTRMDDQQHAISALLRTVAIVDAPTARGHDAPSMWLWGLALVAMLNPLLVGLAVPRGDRRADRATTAAVGGVIGALVVLVAAALSGPILDALDVSRPALRLAVGIVGAVAGLIRLARRVPVPEAATGWLGGALVPVAVPLVASAPLVMLGLGAGADLGVVFVAGCLAIGVGLLTATVAAVPADGPWTVTARWGQRVVTVVGVVMCVLLVIDAVFAI